MTQQPFSRPGAIDLSALKRPPAGAPGPAAAGGAPGADGGSAYSVVLDEQNFQATLESSMTAPVLLVFYSPTRHPASAQLAEDMKTLSDEFEGRFLARPRRHRRGAADRPGDADPVGPARRGRARRPADAALPGRAAARGAARRVDPGGAAAHRPGRHRPAPAAHRRPGARRRGGEEPAVDPRYAPAQDALEAGDIDGAVAAYQKLIDANPADAEAAAGLAMAKVLQRTAGVDLNAARSGGRRGPRRRRRPDAGGRPRPARRPRRRRVQPARRAGPALLGAERDQARQHLLGLFAAVGNDDPRVLKGRQRLASALF